VAKVTADASIDNEAKLQYLRTNQTMFTEKLRSMSLHGMLSAIQFRIFCLAVSYSTT